MLHHQGSFWWVLLTCLGMAFVLTYTPETTASSSSSSSTSSVLHVSAFPSEVSFRLPPRWAVGGVNWLLHHLRVLREAIMPPQLRLLELHFGFVHNRALYAATELGIADMIPPPSSSDDDAVLPSFP